jgi:hypothetical protein
MRAAACRLAFPHVAHLRDPAHHHGYRGDPAATVPAMAIASLILSIVAVIIAIAAAAYTRRQAVATEAQAVASELVV